MSKDTRYSNMFAGMNKKYKLKDIQGKTYKNNKCLIKQLLSELKSDTTSEPQYKIIIGRSKISRLYHYIDNPLQLIEKTDKIESSKQDILRMYKIFASSDEIICKDTAYRKMRDISSSKVSVIKCISNSRKFHIAHINLESHIKAYLYSMIYPSIFENCWESTEDVFLNKYPMLIKLWANMLEDAIIIDGFMNAIHESVMNLFDYRNDILDFESSEVDLIKSSTSYNYKNELLVCYKPIINFAYEVIRKTQEKNSKEKSVRRILNYNFFKAGSRGDKVYRYMTELSQNFFTNQFFYEQEHDFGKVFSLYCLNKQTHIFDFFYHANYKFFDFHLTGGFITNYVIWTISKQCEQLILHLNGGMSKLDEGTSQYDNDIHYTCNEASQCYMVSNLEKYDLYFLRNLISKVSQSFRTYDLFFEKKRIHKLLNMIKNVDDYILSEFRKFSEQVIFKDGSTAISESMNNSEAAGYYKIIYEDLYNKDLDNQDK